MKSEHLISKNAHLEKWGGGIFLNKQYIIWKSQFAAI
jgi:hypothetical protein